MFVFIVNKWMNKHFCFPFRLTIFYPHPTPNLSKKEGSFWKQLWHACHVRLLKNEMTLICWTWLHSWVKGLPRSCASCRWFLPLLPLAWPLSGFRTPVTQQPPSLSAQRWVLCVSAQVLPFQEVRITQLSCRDIVSWGKVHSANKSQALQGGGWGEASENTLSFS